MPDKRRGPTNEKLKEFAIEVSRNTKVYTGPNHTYKSVQGTLQKNLDKINKRSVTVDAAVEHMDELNTVMKLGPGAKSIGMEGKYVKVPKRTQPRDSQLYRIQRNRNAGKPAKNNKIIKSPPRTGISSSPTNKQIKQQKRTQIPKPEENINFDEINTFKYSQGLDAQITAMLQARRNIEDIPRNLRAFGAPFQFTSQTDHRPWKDINIGRKYMENILVEAPIVNFTPGLPSYLPDFDKEQKESVKNYMESRMGGFEGAAEVIAKVSKTDGRYFNFTAAYGDYIQYVNLLCRASAIFLGIGNRRVPGSNTTYANYNWSEWYTQKADIKSAAAKQSAGKGGVLQKVWEAGNTINRIGTAAMIGDYRFVKFFVDPSSSFNESISNSTTQSRVAGLFDMGEGLAKEIRFLGGNVGDAAGKFGAGLVGSFAPNAGGIGADSNFRKLFGMAEHILSGSNITFPEIWSDSTYSKSYQFKVNLKCPYGDMDTYMMSIVVPLMHILAFSTARQTSANSFTSPFLVKVFSKGRFSCEMGIVDSLTITKGGPNGDAWSMHGLPLEMEVSFSVKDLYSQMMITRSSRPELFFYNSSLMEYLSVVGGLDITKPTMGTQIEAMYSTFVSSIFDVPSNINHAFLDYVRQSIEGLWTLF